MAIQRCALLKSGRRPRRIGGRQLASISLIQISYIIIVIIFITILPYYHAIWASTVCRCRVDLRKTSLSLSPALDIVLTVELNFFVSVPSSIKREYSIVTFDGNAWSSQPNEVVLETKSNGASKQTSAVKGKRYRTISNNSDNGGSYYFIV